MAKACQLFSGSSGNSIYISSRQTKFLVDAGVSAKRICTALSNIGEAGEDITAIFITHEHSDHINGIRVLASKYSIPVFAHKAVIESMLASGAINDKVNINEISDNMEIGGIEVVPFELSHDSAACVGYRFNTPDSRSISVCTDTGFVTDAAKKTITSSDMVFLESNHETSMLMNGGYPYYLKKRISSDCGHLSNTACSEFAVDLLKNGTTRLVLSHLSRENNHPDIARQTTVSALSQADFAENRDYRLKVSAPENCERPIVL